VALSETRYLMLSSQVMVLKGSILMGAASALSISVAIVIIYSA
jgi:hypothetical protein